MNDVYSPPGSALAENDPRYAGFWIRMLAFVIDMLILMPPTMFILHNIYGEAYFASDQFYFGFWDMMLNYVLPTVLTIWFWLRFKGTPGKMILKLRVVDGETYEKLSIKQAVVRYFAYILAALPLGLGFIAMGWHARKQGWHDRFAGSVVVRE